MFSFRIDDETELRPLDERHAEELFALEERNLEYLGKWMPWAHGPRSLKDSRGFIWRSLERHASGGGLMAGIWFQGKLVGTIGLNNVDWASRRAEIGYWVSAEHQGKGLVTKSCRALIAHAFNDLKLNRVEIHVATGNARSRAIPERLGFVQEGVLRQVEWNIDHYNDLVVYGMLASEWRTK